MNKTKDVRTFDLASTASATFYKLRETDDIDQIPEIVRKRSQLNGSNTDLKRIILEEGAFTQQMNIKLLPSIVERGVLQMWVPSDEAKSRIEAMLNSLQGTDREDFYQDVLKASYESITNRRLQPLIDVLSSWDSTAEILLDKGLMADLKVAEEEFEHGETIKWQPGMD